MNHRSTDCEADALTTTLSRRLYIELLWFLFSTSEGIQSFKVICECICSVLDRKVRGSSVLVEAGLHLAVKQCCQFRVFPRNWATFH